MANRNHNFDCMARTGSGRVPGSAGIGLTARMLRQEYWQQARDFIEKLIRMQQRMLPQYQRADSASVAAAILKLGGYLSYYPYNCDEKMARFWRKNRYEIRILLPTYRHPAHAKLLTEYEHFDSYAHADRQVVVWQSVCQAINKHS